MVTGNIPARNIVYIFTKMMVTQVWTFAKTHHIDTTSLHFTLCKVYPS